MSAMPADTKPPGSKYDRLIAAAKGVPTVSTVVAHPCDESSLRGAIESAQSGIIKAILVGPAARIKDVAAKHNLDIELFYQGASGQTLIQALATGKADAGAA